MTLAIRAEGLVKHYGETKALDGVDLEVPEGKVVGVLGPNGAGKTTAVRVLATLLDEPTTGLDPHARNEVWAVVRKLAANGTTVLLTTQYLEEAAQLACLRDPAEAEDDLRLRVHHHERQLLVAALLDEPLGLGQLPFRRGVVTEPRVLDREPPALLDHVVGRPQFQRDREATLVECDRRPVVAGVGGERGFHAERHRRTPAVSDGRELLVRAVTGVFGAVEVTLVDQDEAQRPVRRRPRPRQRHAHTTSFPDPPGRALA